MSEVYFLERLHRRSAESEYCSTPAVAGTILQDPIGQVHRSDRPYPPGRNANRPIGAGDVDLVNLSIAI